MSFTTILLLGCEVEVDAFVACLVAESYIIQLRHLLS